MKIIHISDLHFPVSLPILSLKGKMIAGYTNFTLRRKKKYPRELTEALIRFIKKTDYDVLVISGDLTNVAHEKEFRNARQILDPVLDERAFVIPGNHDRYRPEALVPQDLFLKYFGDFSGTSISSQGYIRFKKLGNYAFLGWDSSKPGSLLDAYGTISPEILQNSLKYLKNQKITNYFLVCHHPLWNPGGYEESNHHKMRNREEILQALKQKPPVMVLHGHSHVNWIRNLDSVIPFWIVNSASSTRLSDESHASGFHLIDINSKKVKLDRYEFKAEVNEFIKSELITYNQ